MSSLFWGDYDGDGYQDAYVVQPDGTGSVELFLLLLVGFSVLLDLIELLFQELDYMLLPIGDNFTMGITDALKAAAAVLQAFGLDIVHRVDAEQ